MRSVQCTVCAEIHRYLSPRSITAVNWRALWDDALADATDSALSNCLPYSLLVAYERDDIIHHGPELDVGFVTECLPDNKIDVLFQLGPRILVHDRPDLRARLAPDHVLDSIRNDLAIGGPHHPRVERSPAEVNAALARAREAAAARWERTRRQR